MESRPDELHTPFKVAVLSIGGLNWFRDYWTLFDITSAIEAALIQLCVDSAISRRTINPTSPTQEDILELHDTRKKVLSTLFGSPQIDDYTRHSIAAILLTPSCGVNCDCLQALSDQPDGLVRMFQFLIRRISEQPLTSKTLTGHHSRRHADLQWLQPC